MRRFTDIRLRSWYVTSSGSHVHRSWSPSRDWYLSAPSPPPSPLDRKAGDFAKRINAKKLVLNHFSARYKGDQSVESMTIMTRMERQAMKASGLPEDSLAAAWDFMVLPVPRNG